MLIVRTHFLMFVHFTWRGCKGCLSYRKIPGPYSHKWQNRSQVCICMFSSYSYVHHNIYWPNYRSCI